MQAIKKQTTLNIGSGERELDEENTLPISITEHQETHNPFNNWKKQEIFYDKKPTAAICPDETGTTKDGCITYIEQIDKEEGAPEECSRENYYQIKRKESSLWCDYFTLDSYQKTITKEINDNFAIIKGMKMPTNEQITKYSISLPLIKNSPKHRNTLLLDLDETLIYVTHIQSKVAKETSGKKLEIIYNGELRYIYCILRPFLHSFLKMLSAKYEIIIFTSASPPYAQCICEYIDKKHQYISYILSEANCIKLEGLSIKELKVIKNRELSQMIIIDNSIISFSSNLENGIFIPSFKGEKEDTELKTLMDFLMRIYLVPDVRPFVKQFAGIMSLYENYL